jgi:hypothetical protein
VKFKNAKPITAEQVSWGVAPQGKKQVTLQVTRTRPNLNHGKGVSSLKQSNMIHSIA